MYLLVTHKIDKVKLMLYKQCFIFNIRSFRRRRGLIERCFGILKSSYFSAGSRRFRSRGWHVPIVANIYGALFNKRHILFQELRKALRMRYQCR